MVGCPSDNIYPGRMDESVNYGNPYSWRLNDQWPTQCLIDRTYEYIMSSDIDGWLVGGGYNLTSPDGKLAYVDSSHTEIFRLGSLNATLGGTDIYDVYYYMSRMYRPPILSYPLYVKTGGGGKDLELKIQFSDTTGDGSCVDDNYLCGCPGDGEGEYESYSDCIVTYLGESACSDGDMTDPHMSMIRGAKFFSSDSLTDYLTTVNTQVGRWQQIYTKGVAIGTNATDIQFIDDDVTEAEKPYGYGGTEMFFGRVFITNQFAPTRNLTDDELEASQYTLTNDFVATDQVDDIPEASGSGSQDDAGDWDCTEFDQNDSDNWDPFSGIGLPCGCYADGEAFLGIPLGQYVQVSDTACVNGGYCENYQSAWDLSLLTKDLYKYVEGFGSNHGTTSGLHVEVADNGFATLVEEPNTHIKLFRLGNVNPIYGGISMDTVIDIVSRIKFSTIYLKPAFVGSTPAGNIALYFEMSSSSNLGDLFDSLCKAIGHPDDGGDSSDTYKNYCAIPKMSDSSKYGCYPSASGAGPYCLYADIIYEPRFFEDDDGTAAADYFAYANTVVDSWR